MSPWYYNSGGQYESHAQDQCLISAKSTYVIRLVTDDESVIPHVALLITDNAIIALSTVDQLGSQSFRVGRKLDRERSELRDDLYAVEAVT